MTDTPDTVRRFGRKLTPIRFQIEPGDEVFEAAPKIPADNMLSIVERFSDLRAATDTDARRKPGESFNAATGLLEEVLTPESHAVFRERMGDQTNPIGLEDILDVMRWLIGEAYGLRPTQPPPSSGEQPGTGGTSSTDGAPPETSTPEDSAGTDSSTSSTSGSSTG